MVAGAGIVAGLAAWRERRVHRKRRRKELCELDTLKPSTLVAAGALPAGEPGCTVAPPTSRDVLGPFYVVGAPFRAKLSPPASGGDTIFVSGRVLCAKTGDPLPFTLIDMWQMDPTTDTYDFHWESPESMKQEDRVYHPRQDPNIVLGVTGARSRNFAYRTRLLTDHQGRFEVETERPQPYFDPDDVCEHTGTDKECLCAWRCPHIHVMVQPSTEHRQLISQVGWHHRPRTQISLSHPAVGLWWGWAPAEGGVTAVQHRATTKRIRPPFPKSTRPLL